MTELANTPKLLVLRRSSSREISAAVVYPGFLWSVPDSSAAVVASLSAVAKPCRK